MIHKFPLPSGVIPIDVVHKFDSKVPCELKVPFLNTNNNIANVTKNMPLVFLRLAEKVDSICSLDWEMLLQTRQVGSRGSSGSTTDPRTSAWPTPWNATN